MAKMRVKVKGFKRVEAKLGPVRIAAMKPVHEEERVEERDAWDVISSVSEALTRRYDYVELEVTILERKASEAGLPERIVRGEYSPGLRSAGRHISHRPERLLRLGVVYQEDLTEKAAEAGGYAVLRDEDIKWYKAKGELYVHEGYLEVEHRGKRPAYVVIDTPHGRRWIRMLGASTLRLSSQRESGQQD